MDLEQARDLDDLVRALRDLRAAAGAPSYAEICRRIGERRASLGTGAHRPARATVYDCFRLGRRRLDAELLAEVAIALGEPDARAVWWARACGRLATQTEPPTEPLPAVDVRQTLPSTETPFVGRRAELDAVLTAASEGESPVIVISGMAGVGKTRLAARAAQALVNAGAAERMLFARLGGYDPGAEVADAGAVLDGLVRVAGTASGAATRWAVILDDAADTEQVRTLVTALRAPPFVGSGAAGPIVIITSRTVQALDGSSLELAPMSETDAVDLLRALVGVDMVAAEPEAARALVGAVGALPLAVSLTARRVASTAGWSLADHVDATAERIRDDRTDPGVDLALSSSYAAGDPRHRRVLRQIATQPCPSLDLDEVAVLTDTTPDEAREAVGALAAHHLLQVEDDRWSMHALVRSFARDRSSTEDRPADRILSGQRLAGFVLGQVWAAYRAVNGDERAPRSAVDRITVDATGGHQWLERNVLAVINLAQRGDDLRLADLASDLAEGVCWWLIHNGWSGEAVRLSNASLRRARAAEDTMGIVRALVDLGSATLVGGDQSGAAGYLDEAITLARESGQEREALAALNRRTVIDARAGDLAAAAEGFREVAEGAAKLGDLRTEAKARDNLAIIRRKAGELEAAVELHAWAGELARALGDARQEALASINVSEVLLLLDRPDDALAAAEHGVALAEPLGGPMLGYGLDNAGNALVRLGRMPEAFAALEAALQRSQDVEDLHLECGILNNLGFAYRVDGQVGRARLQHQRAQEVAILCGDRFEQARADLGLGDAADADGDSAEARSRWQQSLVVFEQLAAPEARNVRERLGLDRTDDQAG